LISIDLKTIDLKNDLLKKWFIQTLAWRRGVKFPPPPGIVLFTFYCNKTLARRQELRQIGQKRTKNFGFCFVYILLATKFKEQKNKKYFCLHFSGDKIQTLVRRRELRQIGEKRT
jgi:hypothetical protein